ncbi:MAG TPA: hypothetical protein VNK82_14020 [Terriglobales bacterium]|nr:hypothetical protein [Terriglobales bacterium]
MAVTTKSGFSASPPRLLFEGSYDVHPRREGVWDISADGQRFLMVRPMFNQGPPIQLRVVLNFFSELRRRTEAGGAK